MIDLRSPNALLSDYVERYAHLSPEPSRQLQQRMDYNVRADAPAEPASKPRWLQSRACTLTPEQALDRAKGALLGLAIGDAVGTTLEFLPRDREHVNDMVGGGPFRLAAGEWTDDTSMALCLADTYVSQGKFDYATYANALVRWYRHGENSVNGRCFDIGNATRNALEGWLREGIGWQGNYDPSTAGNGSIIRLAPTAIFRRHSLSASWWESVTQSSVTHNADEAVNCCQLLAAQLHLALNGADKEETLAPAVRSLRPRPMIINAGEYKQKSRDQIRSSGYVVDTLEAALWAVWNSNNFHDAILLAANLADDADSVAATAGQLAGALYGVSGMPPEWVEKVAWSQHIQKLAQELFDRAPQVDELDALLYGKR
ncbi:TPA: ADP-ribosylarginine hydrolase Tri1 [Pseudomonas putida]|jgi:ADP-ribosyl-[dinitrogen reductase] hydrolase|uniref:ADP-ribosylarginine hydrolase Tri1 n=1 Tax=Pseudomonas putida (strain GB-1) TaxID=76869 RepID=TRI1_PSEPG|nr:MULTISPECIES: ADP-ribosylarginine hydrolase Tri1 [Pseudomonas]B0KTG8.1 RecName: Full=ADP-ribosylarginine hydrolase Tri1; AltName: Full=Immunity protein Tri1; Short=Tri1-Pp [Pseudomonas putida GB-1]ABY98655.1 ADP-ribosylation/Crystallin J1 [Pseudomonas putida GB-1]APE98979.1 ADP-ribosylglycohydrolase [Pseudomonas putida]MBP0709610.1 ADP-ribosylglycohydrolase family protein [Pseudomonas sp. T34]MCE1001557.1 ADP-ribosylglycohydrolase family protein [Pseudomonas sp. NMI1173_11]MCK2189053.1 ADP